MKYDIKNIKLAMLGKRKIEWAEKQMDVLREIGLRFSKTKPLKGVKLAACLHVTAETANLMRTLKAGGASVVLCASNPLSTQDEVAASLVKDFGIPVFAKNNIDRAGYYRHLNSALDTKPNITMDDGADLVSLIHTKRKNLVKNIYGGSEETTTGVIRLRALAAEKKLLYPIVAVNDAATKHFFDNRYGTGQSTLDGIIRATNILLAGKTVVVAGYGWCGRGFALKARGMGAKAIVTEVDPVKALEAVMDGLEVKTMLQAAPLGDIFCTLTGDIHIIRKEHFLKMKNGAIVCNSGHFDVELDLVGLKKISKKVETVRPFVQNYHLKNGKSINVLAEGRLINLASAEGHPASVMDMSFANQSLAAEFVVKNYKHLEKRVYDVTDKTDQYIARTKLRAIGVSVDKLTAEQVKYLSSWEMGT
ncbi:MAG: adenosylhomocysteinase [Candidatus Komeilibacteria bacterium]|nr:adenosylhomocysteinase [Candidatus Komeilibacteria bacterium]